MSSSSFVAQFNSAVAIRNSQLSTPFSDKELNAVLAIWHHHTYEVIDFDPDPAFDAVAEVVTDDRVEVACIILEWA